MKKYKVAVIHNIISPYRVPLFESLSGHPSLDLFVYFCAETHKNRKWNIIKSNSYNYEVLSGFSLNFSNIVSHINVSIIPKLVKEKYDVVILSGTSDITTYLALFTCKALNIPIIWWSEATEDSQSKISELIVPFVKYIVKDADAVVVPGSLSKQFHMKLGASLQKIFFVPNVIDYNLFFESSSKFIKDKNRYKTELNLYDKKIILYVGQLIQRKGVEYLIKAYLKLKSEYDEVCLIIVGDGSSKESLETMCRDNNIEDVYFKGWVSEEQKILYYSIADLFVLPTLRDLCPLVLVEAMSCGLPVISTKSAQCSFDLIVPKENGFIVDAANVDELYLSITKIVLNDVLRMKMKNKSLNIIKENYSLNKCIDGFFSAIKFAVNKPKNKPKQM